MNGSVSKSRPMPRHCEPFPENTSANRAGGRESMPLGEERGRIAGGIRLEPGGELFVGPAKGSEPMLVMGPSGGGAATQSR